MAVVPHYLSLPLHPPPLLPPLAPCLGCSTPPGAHLTGSRLDATWMKGFGGYHIHNLFGIEAKVDQELQPGITISKNVSHGGCCVRLAGVDSHCPNGGWGSAC
jgi:hypothetical protein